MGTGNYNEKTAAQYTDVSLLTANPDIGADAAEFFKNMSIGNLDGDVQAPAGRAGYSLKRTVHASCIDEEIAKGPRRAA